MPQICEFIIPFAKFFVNQDIVKPVRHSGIYHSKVYDIVFLGILKVK